MLVKHDFIRYLALKLFGTVNGVDLFNNEVQMVQALNYIGNTSLEDISGTFWKYSSHSTFPDISGMFLTDASNNMRYATDEFNTNENICRELFYQLLYEKKERFANLVTDNNYLVGLPILEGDVINFNFTINPSPGQNVLTGVPEFFGRNYRIKLIVDDGTGVNTVPDI
jgi:hypothetical protein